MVDSWDIYNNFLLHGEIDRLTKILARFKLFERIVNYPGDIVECGVMKGAGVLLWAKLIQIFNPLSIRRVVGFDTFEEGYPIPENRRYETDKYSIEKFIEESSYTPVSRNSIMKVAESLGLDKRIELIKGDVAYTIKEYVESNPGFRIALLNLDFDIYEPTIVALKHLYPRVVPKGIVIIDEYSKREWSESHAIDEYFKEKAVIHSFPWALSPTAFIIKGESDE